MHPTFKRAISERDPAALRELARIEPSLLSMRSSLGETVFHYLVIEADLDSATVLADLGADIDASDDFGETPLSHAVQLDYDELVNWLIARKADLNAGRPPPLHHAAENHRLSIARELLDAGARVDVVNDMGDPLLHVAVEHDFLELVDLLLERGADIRTISAAGESVLHVAACYASEDLCRRLLAAGASPDVCNPDGQRPTDVAVAFGRDSIAELLRLAARNSSPP